MGQADVISKPSKPDAVVETPKVARGDSSAQDSALTRTFQIPKGGESSPVMLPLTDSVIASPLPEMPPQGPSDSVKQAFTGEISSDSPGEMPSDSLMDGLLEEATDRPALQTYTSSSMLAWGQWEARYFQQIYTQTHFFDEEGKPQPQNNRSTYYAGIASLTLGWKSWINFGVDAWLRSVRIDAENASPFAVLSFQSGPNSRTSLSTIGPKVKIQPFRKFNGFTIQSSLLFPIAKDQEGRLSGRPYLGSQNLLWWTQFFYTRGLGSKWQIFAELDLYASLNTGAPSQGQPSTIALPVSAFLSYFPTRRITVYAMNQAWMTSSSIWYQVGIGGKYRITDGLDLELMYGRFLAGINAAGQANAFNLGLRIVHW